jgi:hypothetical protein
MERQNCCRRAGAFVTRARALRRDAGGYRDNDDESVKFQALRFDRARAAR